MKNRITATYDRVTNSATVTAFGETRAFDKVWDYHKDHVVISGVFACKFRTGTRLWGGTVTLWLNDDDSVRAVNIYAGYGKNGKRAPILVGWYDRSNVEHNSKVG